MTSPDRRKLPLGIQTFREIRSGDYYYVDKTAYVGRLLDEGKHYFLSRPRRFGKSLFLDTCKELFEGNEPLFRGLDIHDRWDWSIRHPVLRLSFGGGNFTEPGSLLTNLMAQLDAVERRSGVASACRHRPRAARGTGRSPSPQGRAARCGAGRRIRQAHPRRARHAGCRTREPRLPARGLRGRQGRRRARPVQLLHGGEQVLQGQPLLGPQQPDRYHAGAGVSAVCGYTDRDLDTVFAPELPGLDRDQIREWYNGYRWLGEEVYNPFDILLLFRRRKFGAYWFETGTPTFLLDTLFKRRVSSVELGSMVGDSELLSTFDVDDMSTEALLFQTGYLTIAGEADLAGEPLYRLSYPNREVRQSLNRSLLRYLVKDATRQVANSVRLYELLETGDFAGLEALFQAFFSSIPYEWYTNNDIADYEGYYASVFYSYFAALGLDITVEDSTSHGRLDMAVRFGGNVYLFEFKVVELEPKGAAMAQLKAKAVRGQVPGTGAGRYTWWGWSSAGWTRNVVGFEVERG